MNAEVKLTKKQKDLKKKFEDNMNPHIGHVLIYKERHDRKVMGRLARITFAPDSIYDMTYVWYEGNPFPIKSYWDMVVECYTCSKGDTVA